MKSHALEPKTGWARFVDPKPGFRMMLDPSVPLRWKALAYVAGIAITWVLEFFEVPLTLAALMLPGGIFLDLAIEGSEALVVPIWIACVLLPRMSKPRLPKPNLPEAPKELPLSS